jgi:hypothetical protein
MRDPKLTLTVPALLAAEQDKTDCPELEARLEVTPAGAFPWGLRTGACWAASRRASRGQLRPSNKPDRHHGGIVNYQLTRAPYAHPLPVSPSLVPVAENPESRPAPSRDDPAGGDNHGDLGGFKLTLKQPVEVSFLQGDHWHCRPFQG